MLSWMAWRIPLKSEPASMKPKDWPTLDCNHWDQFWDRLNVVDLEGTYDISPMTSKA